MSRLPAPATAFLVDKKGIVHGTHVFINDRNVQQSIDHLNPCVFVASGGLKYTLAEPGSGEFLTHLKKLFEAETSNA